MTDKERAYCRLLRSFAEEDPRGTVAPDVVDSVPVSEACTRYVHAGGSLSGWAFRSRRAFDETAVEALDRAVAAGMATTRAALVAAAVREWLSRHGEEAIVESYRRRYEHPDAAEADLVARIGDFSAAACLDDER